MTSTDPRLEVIPEERDDASVDAEVIAVVRAAAAGDQRAWDDLVERYHRLVWAVVRSYRLSSADAADVTQTTWLKLVENLGSLRDPARVGAWLATTARREALRLAQQRRADLDRAVDVDLTLVPHQGGAVDEALLRDEADVALHRALLSLGERCQRLLRALAASPPPHYEQIADAFGMPIGSIGPTRGRCLDRLRTAMTEMGWAR